MTSTDRYRHRLFVDGEPVDVGGMLLIRGRGRATLLTEKPVPAGRHRFHLTALDEDLEEEIDLFDLRTSALSGFNGGSYIE